VPELRIWISSFSFETLHVFLNRTISSNPCPTSLRKSSRLGFWHSRKMVFDVRTYKKRNGVRSSRSDFPAEAKSVCTSRSIQRHLHLIPDPGIGITTLQAIW